jgi:hypothetical protein
MRVERSGQRHGVLVSEILHKLRAQVLMFWGKAFI